LDGWHGLGALRREYILQNQTTNPDRIDTGLEQVAATANFRNLKLIGSIIHRFRSLLGDQLAAKLFGPGLSALIIKIASAGLSYFMLVSFARMLSPADYGHFGVMLNIAIVLSAVAALGLPTGIMRYWAGYIALGDRAHAKGFHIASQKILSLVGLLTLALGLVASWQGWWSNAFGLQLGALLVALLAIGFSFGDYYANALRAQDEVLWSMVPRDIIWRIIAPVFAAAILWSTGGLSSGQAFACCVIVMVIVAVAQGVKSAQVSKRLTGNVAAATNWSKWRRPLIPLAGASVLYAMVQQLDVVVIGAYLGAEEAGAYFAAQKTASLLGLVMIAGGLVAAPMMAAAFQADKKAELQRICKMLALAIAMTTGIGFVVLAMLGKPLLAIFDPAYQSAYPLLLILGLGYAIDALAGPTAYLMQMTSLEGAYLRIMAVVYAFVLSLQIVFVPKYGAIAAAGATALGVALWNIIAIYQLRRSIGVDSSILSFFLPPRQS
jgi:O-antigen/teichoic acid export membrane protein